MSDQPCTPTWRHTYNGIPVIELGEDGEWIIAPGHIDTVAFAAACEAFYQDVCGESLPGTDPAASITHTTARITPAAEFPYGEYEVRFNDGDLQITVWTKP